MKEGHYSGLSSGTNLWSAGFKGLWPAVSKCELRADLREGGLDTEAALPVVIDGAKALCKGIRELFGERTLVQRCRVHKRRNVLDHLPQDKRAQAACRLCMTWAQPTAEAALQALRACVQCLDTISPNAARSLEEGLEETLTLHRLGLNEPLRRSLSSTNRIESCFARTASWTRRVKRRRDARMLMRWGGRRVAGGLSACLAQAG